MNPSQRELVESLLDRISAAGGRKTGSRRLILEAIISSKDHLNADQLHRRISKRFPNIDRSTVYRALDALEALGIIDHTHLGHSGAIYHLTHDEHHHLVCEGCGAVEEVPVAEIRTSFEKIRRDFGFSVDPRHFALVGLCHTCAKRNR